MTDDAGRIPGAPHSGHPVAPHDIAVIIPAYNAAAFLRDCLDSVLEQTLPAREIVVIDDGSTDATVNVAATFGPAVRVVSQPNAGAAAARNRGGRETTSAWLAFLDADDLWIGRKLELQSTAQLSSQAELVYSDRYNIGEHALPERQSRLKVLPEGEIFSALLLDGNMITTSSVLMSRRAFEELGGFCEDPALLPAEDYDLWLRFASERHVACVSEPLVKYRLHAAGVSRDPQKMNRARLLAVQRASTLRRFSSLTLRERRLILSQTLATNGWDAARHEMPKVALECYLRAIAAWPFRLSPFTEILRLMIRSAVHAYRR